MAPQDFTERRFGIASRLSSHTLGCCHRVLNRASDIGVGSTGEIAQCFMNLLRGRVQPSGRKLGDNGPDCRFECLWSSHFDSPVNQLPANALPHEELVDLNRKAVAVQRGVLRQECGGLLFEASESASMTS